MGNMLGGPFGLRKMKDYDSSFESSKYFDSYKKANADYQKKRDDYLAEREAKQKAEQSKRPFSFNRKNSSSGSSSKDDAAKKAALEKEVQAAIGSAPSIRDYYNQFKDWKGQGSPEYQAVNEQVDNSMQDNPASSGGSAPFGSAVAKGYELSGARSKVYGYSPSQPAGDGVGRRQTDESGESGGDLGTAGDAGTGQPVRKRYKPLGK